MAKDKGKKKAAVEGTGDRYVDSLVRKGKWDKIKILAGNNNVAAMGVMSRRTGAVATKTETTGKKKPQ